MKLKMSTRWMGLFLLLTLLKISSPPLSLRVIILQSSDSGIHDEAVARGLLNAIFLPWYEAKYKKAMMTHMLAHQE